MSSENTAHRRGREGERGITTKDTASTGCEVERFARGGARRRAGVGDAAAPWGLEVDADAAALERLDGVVCEGRAQELAAEPLELLAVAAVDGRRGVQVHAEGRHRRRAVAALLEALKEAGEVPAHELRRVAVVGLPLCSPAAPPAAP
jgi:hypothetical protein